MVSSQGNPHTISFTDRCGMKARLMEQCTGQLPLSGNCLGNAITLPPNTEFPPAGCGMPNISYPIPSHPVSLSGR